MFSYTLGKYPSLWLLAWRSLEAFSRLNCLFSSVTMCAVMLWICIWFMYRRNKITTHPKYRRNGLLLLSRLILGAFFCLPLREKLENPTQSPAANGSGLRCCSLLLVTESNSKAFTINSDVNSCANAWSWQYFAKNHFSVQKYSALTNFVHNHQFKELKNSDFHTQNYFPAMRCMKSAGKLAPGTQVFAPLHDPDPRADASELSLQAERRNIFLEYVFLKWATQLVQIKAILSLYWL